MGLVKLVLKLKKIDKECETNEQLKKRLEPWVIEMNKYKPCSRTEAEKISEKFIAEYERIKADLEKS